MPRRLLRDGEVVADEWLTFDEAAFGAAAELADERPLMLPLDQWLSDRDRWLSRESPLGVIVGPAHKVEILVPDLARFDLIGVEFPTIGEGRGYTQGRLLRERWRFSGELRAWAAYAATSCFFSRAAASTASSCRTAKSKARDQLLQLSPPHINQQTMQDCRSNCGAVRLLGNVAARTARSSRIVAQRYGKILQYAIHFLLRLQLFSVAHQFAG